MQQARWRGHLGSLEKQGRQINQTEGKRNVCFSKRHIPKFHKMLHTKKSYDLGIKIFYCLLLLHTLCGKTDAPPSPPLSLHSKGSENPPPPPPPRTKDPPSSQSHFATPCQSEFLAAFASRGEKGGNAAGKKKKPPVYLLLFLNIRDLHGGREGGYFLSFSAKSCLWSYSEPQPPPL